MSVAVVLIWGSNFQKRAPREIFLYDAAHVMETGENWTRGSFILVLTKCHYGQQTKERWAGHVARMGTMINAYSNIEVPTRCTCHRVYFI
jgi:hypothetical protein